MSKKGEYETGKSKALRVAIIGCFAVFTVFARSEEHTSELQSPS